VALVGLVAVVIAVGLVTRIAMDDGRSADAPSSAPLPAGVTVPSSALEGTWSGEGSLTDCAGFDDEGCPAVRSVTLRIDCSEEPCVVTPFDRDYGRAPLRFEDGAYRAAGPVPARVAPTCGGTPTRSALWRLELTVQDGRLVGSYAESTIQGFDCGATWLRWQVTLYRG
jgi:hypothetical protein